MLKLKQVWNIVTLTQVILHLFTYDINLNCGAQVYHFLSGNIIP